MRVLTTARHLSGLAAEEWQAIEKAPVIRLPKEPLGRLRFMAKDEVARLLPACERSQNRYLRAIATVASTSQGRSSCPSFHEPAGAGSQLNDGHDAPASRLVVGRGPPCRAAPTDTPFVERHRDFSVPRVRRGSFWYRRRVSIGARAGSILVGYPGDEYLCQHDHPVGGDECPRTGRIPAAGSSRRAAPARLDGDTRIVAFGNGMVVRELLVDVDDDARRLVWSARGGRLTHHNASAQVFAEGEGRCRLAWIADLLPHELAPGLRAMTEQGAAAMKKALEKR